MRVVPLEAFKDKVSIAAVIAAVERGFQALAMDQAELPEPMAFELPDPPRPSADIHVKGAHLKGGRFVVVKVATGFPGNRERGIPAADGMFLLLDATTGVPTALLEDHGFLTDLRTAAAIALTLKYLAPADARQALLVGAGGLARLTARAIVAERPIEQLTIWNRTPERAAALAKDIGAIVPTKIAHSLEQAVRAHRIIVCVTSSTTPLIRASWVAPGTHITSAGTDSPEKVELEPALLAKADKLVADRIAQTERYGNLHHAIAAGIMTRERVYAELGQIAAGQRTGRERPNEITIADLTGVGVQDAAVAEPVVEVLGL